MTINLKNFLKDKPKLSKMGEFQELEAIEGLEISAVSADLYGSGRDDLCLFYFKDGANYGAVYTNNTICSESINWNRNLREKFIKGLLVNTQNANTFTGVHGLEGLQTLSKTLSRTLTLKEAQKKDGPPHGGEP
jgi:N-acetylglutamate synthase (N-acetylornithine aminotransferase)